jgi:hypothetical protein
MRELYIVAVALVILWLIGFVGMSANGIIHLLLLFAAICIGIPLFVNKRL